MGALIKASRPQHWEKIPAHIFSLELDGVCNNAVFLKTSCEHCLAGVPESQPGCPPAPLVPEDLGHLPAGQQSPAATTCPGALKHINK